MSEVTVENENQLNQVIENDVSVKESNETLENADLGESHVNEGKGIKKKASKKTLGIFCAIAAVVVVVLVIILMPSKFKKVEKECVQIAGQAGTGKNYFTLDTDPYEDYDANMRALLLPNTQTKTLEAIKYANKELGFPSSVYSDMMKTTAIMGRQNEENSKYKVSWTYHPDHGLEVTYTKK